MRTLDHQSGTTAQQEAYSANITMGIVKPHAYSNREDIEYMITKSGLSIPVKKYPFYIPRNLAALHYEAHRGKPFYRELIEMMTDGPVEIMVVEGENAIERLNLLTGSTDPKEAKPGTIRRRFGDKEPGRMMYNAFHRSDSPKSVKREVSLYWKKEELPERIAELLDQI